MNALNKTEMKFDEQTTPHPGMVWIPGRTFLMGSDKHYPEEAPAHEVTASTVSGWMCTQCCLGR